jgi:adenylate cyclase
MSSVSARRGIAARDRRAFALVTLVTDMVDSTALLRRLGEHATQAVMREHNDIVRSCLRAFGCREVKFTGDGFLATHTSAIRALQCAAAIQEAAVRRSAGRGEPIQVRVALDAGEVLIDDRDLIGSAVNAATRMCAEALPGQILASAAVVALAGNDAFAFVPRGDRLLKGFEAPMAVFEVQPPARDADRATLA